MARGCLTTASSPPHFASVASRVRKSISQQKLRQFTAVATATPLGVPEASIAKIAGEHLKSFQTPPNGHSVEL